MISVRRPAKETSSSNKVIVVGMVERGGKVMTKIVPDTTDRKLRADSGRPTSSAARRICDRRAQRLPLATKLAGFIHGTVLHEAKEYVRGDTHTNTH